ncbi:unnamed protein product, partial [Nesidiocoris tenuis]
MKSARAAEPTRAGTSYSFKLAINQRAISLTTVDVLFSRGVRRIRDQIQRGRERGREHATWPRISAIILGQSPSTTRPILMEIRVMPSFIHARTQGSPQTAQRDLESSTVVLCPPPLTATHDLVPFSKNAANSYAK